MTDILAERNKAKTAAMKSKLAGDADAQSTLSVIRSAIGEVERDSKDKSPRGALAVLKGEVKKREATAVVYDEAGESDRAAIERREAAVLDEFLPKEPTELELQRFIADYVGANGLEGAGNKALGEVMKAVKGEYESVDGKLASTLARKSLT